MNDHQRFDDITELPNPNSAVKYESLIGLDEVKDRLIKEAEILFNPGLLEEWSTMFHGTIIPIVKQFDNRRSLFIFAGDVGTGKTTLAETFGDYIARKNNKSVLLYRLSLNTRGQGAVGEMTRLISAAFQEIAEHAEKISKTKGVYSSACILLIDEADALAQSRELGQMHHEDRAGVNALIRGIDSITEKHLPVIMVMCTNRLGAIDPAVRRRAAATFEFKRPTEEQRLNIFRVSMVGTGVSEDDIIAFAKATGESKQRDHGYTFSDIIQNILPAIVLKTYPDKPITANGILQVIEQTLPTPPFEEGKTHEKP